MSRTPDSRAYEAEPTRFESLEVIDVRGIASAVSGSYRNLVLYDVNDHCVRLSVMEGEYPWHSHASDELFLVLDGKLVIELDNGKRLELMAGEATCIPHGRLHRTRSAGRAVTVCFEKRDSKTQFLDSSEQQT